MKLKSLGTSLYLLLTAGPLLMGLGYSLLYSLGLIGLMNDGFTLSHWAAILTEGELFTSFFYSLYITVASLILILGLALFFAWQLFRDRNPQKLYAWFFIPLTFPPLIAAFSWAVLLSPGGVISRMAFHLGFIAQIEEFPRLINDFFSIGILITHVFLVFPLFTLLFIHQSKKERLGELREISVTLGASGKQFLRTVFIPLLLKKSIPLIVLYGIFIFGAYEVPLLNGRSSPRMMSVLITEKLNQYSLTEIPQGYAISFFYCILIIGLIGLSMRKNKPMLW